MWIVRKNGKTLYLGDDLTKVEEAEATPGAVSWELRGFNVSWHDLSEDQRAFVKRVGENMEVGFDQALSHAKECKCCQASLTLMAFNQNEV